MAVVVAVVLVGGCGGDTVGGSSIGGSGAESKRVELVNVNSSSSTHM